MSKFLKWTFVVLVLMMVLSAVTGGLVLGALHDGLSQTGSWHVVVDGNDFGDWNGIDIEGVGAGELIAGALAIGFTLVVVLPLVLLLGVGLPILLTLGALGLVALVLTGVSLMLLGPLLLPLLLIWLVVRPKRPAATKA